MVAACCSCIVRPRPVASTPNLLFDFFIPATILRGSTYGDWRRHLQAIHSSASASLSKIRTGEIDHLWNHGSCMVAAGTTAELKTGRLPNVNQAPASKPALCSKFHSVNSRTHHFHAKDIEAYILSTHKHREFSYQT